ncbi:hypothetical protein VNN41_06595 [Lactococcus garvieae]|uniref:hypothetical protein n=1 Tax=Lactococcus garvieae TaxID=1363 RepID=UPI00324BBADC
MGIFDKVKKQMLDKVSDLKDLKDTVTDPEKLKSAGVTIAKKSVESGLSRFSGCQGSSKNVVFWSLKM